MKKHWWLASWFGPNPVLIHCYGKIMPLKTFFVCLICPWKWRWLFTEPPDTDWILPRKPIHLDLRENCLKDCLDDLAKRWEEAFQRKGARLETKFEPSIPPFPFDYQKVQQAAANLLDHALCQALPNSTVTLHCMSRPDGVDVSLTGATEHDQKVFDNYPTPYSRPRDHQENLDLGLTIAKSLVLAHGGRIWVEPSSTGSKFVFVLTPAS